MSRTENPSRGEDHVYAETRPPSTQVAPVPMARRLHTPAGLKWGSYAMILSIVTSIVAFLILIPLRTIDFETITSENVLEALAGLLAMACIVAILGLIVIIFYILLLYEMYVGRHEFGEKHSARVSAGLILVIFGVIFTFITGFIVGAAGGYTGDEDYTIDAAEFKNQQLMSSSLGIVGTVAVTLGLILFPLELIAREKRYLLWVALALAVLASVFSSLAIYLVIPSEGTFELQDVLNWSSYASVFSAVGIFGTIVMLIAYRMTRARILSGDIQPVSMPGVQPPYPPTMPPPQWGAPPPSKP